MYYDANLSIFTLVFKCLIYFNYAITNIIFTARQGGSIKIFKLGVSVWREQRHLPLCTDSNSTYICLYSIYTDTASIQLLYRICTAFFQPRFASIQPSFNLDLPLYSLYSTSICLLANSSQPLSDSLQPLFGLHSTSICLSVSKQSSFNLYLTLYILHSTSICLCTSSIQPTSASIWYSLHTASVQNLHRLLSASNCFYTIYTAFINIHLPLNRLQSTFVCLYTTSI